MTILDKAIEYVTVWDFAVFPCHYILVGKCSCGRNCSSPGKHPIPHIGFKAATKDVNQVKHFWQTNPSANIGIATGKLSNLVVLDVDPKYDGHHSLKLLCDEIGEFTTYTVRTGSGGLHFYFRYPTDCEIKNSAGATNNLGKGLDIRGEGGYVIAPPSNHLSGTNYEVLFDGVIAELPEKLKEKLLQPKVQQPISAGPGIIAPPSNTYAAPDVVYTGARNIELTRLAGSLRRSGLSELAVTSALQIENQRLCQPPLPNDEVRRIAHSVSRYAPDEILQTIADDPALQNVNQVNQIPKITTTGFFKFDELVERSENMPPREVIAMHIARREWAVLAATKNAGKSTFMRNVCIHLGAGKYFDTFVEDSQSRKVLYLDFETTEEMLSADLKIMFAESGFSQLERDLVKKNVIFAPKGLIDGDLFNFRKHFSQIQNICQDEKIDFLVLDNLSSGFEVLDESANGVLNKLVVNPIKAFIEQSNLALVLIHHAGKSNNNDDYGGRGASVLEDMSTVGFKMQRDRKSPIATISCLKRKDGEEYDKVYKLNRDRRWFENTVMAPKTKQKPLDIQVQEFVQAFDFPNMVTTKDINTKFSQIGRIRIQQILNVLKNQNYISSPKKGYFCNYIEP